MKFSNKKNSAMRNQCVSGLDSERKNYGLFGDSCAFSVFCGFCGKNQSFTQNPVSSLGGVYKRTGFPFKFIHRRRTLLIISQLVSQGTM